MAHLAILKGLEIACLIKDFNDCVIGCCQAGFGRIFCLFEYSLTCCTGWEEFRLFFKFERDDEINDAVLPTCKYRWKTNAWCAGFGWFVLACVFICNGLAFAKGRPEVYDYGVDHWGNVCGDSAVSPLGISDYSNIYQKGFSKVLALDLLNKEIFNTTSDGINGKLPNPDLDQLDKTKSVVLCVKNCPNKADIGAKNCQQYLSTNEMTKYPADLLVLTCNKLENFGMEDDSVFKETNSRCIPSKSNSHYYNPNYNLDVSNSTGLVEESIKNFNVMNNVKASIDFLEIYNYSWFHILMTDIVTSLWQCLIIFGIGLAFTFLLVHILIFLSAAEKLNLALYWINYALFIIVSIIVTVYSWVTYSKDTSSRIVLRDLSIVLTIITILIFICGIIVDRSALNLISALYSEAKEFLTTLWLKFILLVPLFTILCYLVTFAYFGFILRYVSSVFNKPTEAELANYTTGDIITPSRAKDYLIVMTIFLVGVFYMFCHFIIQCQNFVVATAVSIWYFTTPDSPFKKKPIYITKTGTSWLWQHHHGSLVQAAVVLSVIDPIRAVFIWFQSKLKAGGCFERNFTLCVSMRQFFDTLLVYFSKMNIIQIALNSTTFFGGGEDVVYLLIESGIQPGILTTHSWMMFVTKITISIATIPFSIIFLYLNRTDLFRPGGPIVVGIILTLLVSHIYFSVVSTAMETIFICVLEDWKLHGKGIKDPEQVSLFCSHRLKIAVSEVKEIPQEFINGAKGLSKDDGINGRNTSSRQSKSKVNEQRASRSGRISRNSRSSRSRLSQAAAAFADEDWYDYDGYDDIARMSAPPLPKRP